MKRLNTFYDALPVSAESNNYSLTCRIFQNVLKRKNVKNVDIFQKLNVSGNNQSIWLKLLGHYKDDSASPQMEFLLDILFIYRNSRCRMFKTILIFFRNSSICLIDRKTIADLQQHDRSFCSNISIESRTKLKNPIRTRGGEERKSKEICFTFENRSIGFDVYSSHILSDGQSPFQQCV